MPLCSECSKPLFSVMIRLMNCFFSPVGGGLNSELFLRFETEELRPYDWRMKSGWSKRHSIPNEPLIISYNNVSSQFNMHSILYHVHFVSKLKRNMATILSIFLLAAILNTFHNNLEILLKWVKTPKIIWKWCIMVVSVSISDRVINGLDLRLML